MKGMLFIALIVVVAIVICACSSVGGKQKAQETQGETLPADDEGLVLLAGYCRRTVATVGGDSYSEIALYRNDRDGGYELRTRGSGETPRVYPATEEMADAIAQLIGRLRLAEYENARGIGPEGVEYVVRFLQGDRVIRVSTDNLGDDGAGRLAEVGEMLYSFLTQNRHQEGQTLFRFFYAEYAERQMRKEAKTDIL